MIPPRRRVWLPASVIFLENRIDSKHRPRDSKLPSLDGIIRKPLLPFGVVVPPTDGYMSLSTITIVTRLSLGAAARYFFFCIAAKTSFVFIVVVTESSITVSQPANYSVDLCVVSIIFDRSSPPKVACN